MRGWLPGTGDALGLPVSPMSDLGRSRPLPVSILGIAAICAHHAVGTRGDLNWPSGSCGCHPHIASSLLMDLRKNAQLTSCVVKKSSGVEGQMPRARENEMDGKRRWIKL